MTTGKSSESPLNLDWYQVQPGIGDEMWDGAQVQGHWAYFMRSLQELGFAEMERRRQEANRLLRENGVTYNIYSDPQGYNRIWDLDPIPSLIDSEQWASIEAGLVERAELLNLVLTDLYGKRELIKHKLLPPELVFSHSGFLRPCDQVQQYGAQQLILYAADLARDHHGEMCVLGDRTQVPSGAGYALENRTVTSRIVPSLFRDSHVHRLSMFFHSLRHTLAELAPGQKDDPRIVVLTPGPFNETYFEHAYLASYLGFNLVQGDNLLVKDGKVWMKAVGGLQQVDVILRRVDDHFCDPVELRSDSRLGIPGLLEAVRRGNVVVANPLGSSVLENPGLMAFLPAIARHYFGHELKLNSVATWWCGQRSERKYVLDNLQNLIIKPINRLGGRQAIFGSELSQAELAQWRAQICARPHLYVGQEQLPLSTVPTLIEGRPEPRHAVLRSFLVSEDKGYTAMPGGLTRAAQQEGNFKVSNQAACLSKDTWVLASEPEKLPGVRPAYAISTKVPDTTELPSRAADDMFWVGRYVERAEGTARLLRSVLHRFEENDEFDTPANRQCLNIFLRALTNLTTIYPGFVGEGAEVRLADPQQHLLDVSLNTELTGSLASTLHYFQKTAYAVRDRWSTDIWRVIDNLDAGWRQAFDADDSDQLSVIQDRLDELLSELAAFSGLFMDSMTRDYGWYFMDIGRRIERSIMLSNLLGTTCVHSYDFEVEVLMLEDLMRTTENLLTYRRKYRSGFQRLSALKLLLLKSDNPRSLVYQVNTLSKYISRLPREQSDNTLSAEERYLLEISTRLRLLDVEGLLKYSGESLAHPELDSLLRGIIQSMSSTSNAITDNYFNHGEGPQPFGQSSRIIES